MSTTVDLGKITASVTVGTTTTGAAGTNASVSNSGTTQDAVLNFTIPRGAQGVQGPQGSTGPQGPAGPTGPQGPMGDVAVITPEQQAAFTMYSTTGQNTDGPMTQKAVTDALGDIAASEVSYDNSQSGLAVDNVQGALDDYASLLLNNKIANSALDRNGEVFSGQGYYATDFLRLSGNIISIHHCYHNTRATGICLYDKDRNFIGFVPRSDSRYEYDINVDYSDLVAIDSDVYYIRVTLKGDAGCVMSGIVNDSAKRSYNAEYLSGNIQNGQNVVTKNAILGTDGQTVVNSNYSQFVTNFMELDGKDVYIHNSYQGNIARIMCIYDENLAFLAAYSDSTNGVSDRHIKYSSIVALSSSAKYIRCTLSQEGYVSSGVKNVVAQIAEELDFSYGRNVTLAYSKTILAVNSDGTERLWADASFEGYGISDYIELTGGEFTLFRCYQGGTADPIHYYDERMNYIGKLRFGTNGVQVSEIIQTTWIPASAKYARFTFETNGYWNVTGAIRRINWHKINNVLGKLAAPVTYGVSIVLDGTALNGSGEIVKKDIYIGRWGVSPIYRVTGEDISVYNSFQGTGAVPFAFYDKNFAFVSVYRVGDNGTANRTCPASSIPSDAIYVRCTLSLDAGQQGVYSGVKTLDGNDNDAYIRYIAGSSSENNILAFNKDAEISLPNIARTHRDHGEEVKKPLVLLHFSDLHADADNLGRIVEFRNKYNSFIDDSICTGDIVHYKYSDDFTFWASIAGTENIMIAIGNHESRSGNNWSGATAAQCYTKFMGNIAQWGVTYSPNLCYYYKDYTTEGVRLIVVDAMHVDSAQKTWLQSTLASAGNLHVVIAEHLPVAGSISTSYNFDSLMTRVFSDSDALMDNIVELVEVVDTWINGGGKFICWLAGHSHCDQMQRKGLNEQLFINVGCACGLSDQTKFCDCIRTSGTRMQDLFNIFGVDTLSKTLSLYRIGADQDRYMRSRQALCYNYETRQILWQS